MKASFWVFEDSGQPGKGAWLVWSLLGNPGNDLLPLMQSVNKIKLFTVGLHYASRRPSPQPQQFLFSTNQSAPPPSIPPPPPPHTHTHSSPSSPLALWDSAVGSHSSGMNLSRLEHSAKGHYPGLHVCWAAVLSYSTRCCCDHWVTCDGRVSSCNSSFNSLLLHLPSPWDVYLRTTPQRWS